MALIYIIEFFIFSFIGWILDSGYRSIAKRKLINAGYFRGPICPIYGIGGLILVFLLQYFNFLHIFWSLIISSFSLIFLEYVGGIFSEKVLKVRLWDYSETTFNIGGHIDLLHSAFWIILTVLFYFLIFPYVILLEKIIIIPEYLNFPGLLLFVVMTMWVTIRKNPQQFLEFRGHIIDMSVSEYQKVFSHFKKLSRAESLTLKKKWVERLRTQLKNTGAKLKNIEKLKKLKNE